jgi:hypothetical protein
VASKLPAMLAREQAARAKMSALEAAIPRLVVAIATIGAGLHEWREVPPAPAPPAPRAANPSERPTHGLGGPASEQPRRARVAGARPLYRRDGQGAPAPPRPRPLAPRAFSETRGPAHEALRVEALRFRRWRAGAGAARQKRHVPRAGAPRPAVAPPPSRGPKRSWGLWTPLPNCRRCAPPRADGAGRRAQVILLFGAMDKAVHSLPAIAKAKGKPLPAWAAAWRRCVEGVKMVTVTMYPALFGRHA